MEMGNTLGDELFVTVVIPVNGHQLRCHMLYFECFVAVVAALFQEMDIHCHATHCIVTCFLTVCGHTCGPSQTSMLEFVLKPKCLASLFPETRNYCRWAAFYGYSCPFERLKNHSKNFPCELETSRVNCHSMK